MRRKPRKLTEDDRAVWKAVASRVKPLAADKADPVPEPRPAPLSPRPHASAGRGTPQRIPPKPEPLTNLTLRPDPMGGLRDTNPTMDAKTFGRMRRGKMQPEARIDLHGMHAERAHHALRGFVLDAHARGLRFVLVITGKGRPVTEDTVPERRGVLRNAVPVWLAQPPLAALILQIAPAHQRHGGGGAYYVYLRRRR